MTITRRHFHLLVRNEYQYAFKLVQMKVEAQVKKAASCGALTLYKKDGK